MEPLSVTANVIAVLQATEAVISICCDYQSSVKGSEWELPRVLREIRGLQDVLGMLKELTEEAEMPDSSYQFRLPALRSLCDPDTGALDNCSAELEALKCKLTPSAWSGPAGSKRRGLVEALSWPLKKGETEKILKSIERTKNTINMAMAVDQTKSNLAIGDDTKGIQKSISSMQLEAHHEAMRRWLRPTDPSSKYNKALQEREASTGLWLTEMPVFRKWMSDPNSLIWLHGIAGSGKTILCSTAIENILQHRNIDPALTAYFYFEYNDQGKQSCDAMLRSLIGQLSQQCPKGIDILDALYVACGSGTSQPTLSMLMKTMRELVTGSANVFIVLDALDECIERDDLMANLEELAMCELDSLHLLATSRKEKEIEDVLSELLDDEHQICIQSALIEGDIQAYIRTRIQTDRKLQKWQKPEVQKEIETVLIEKAGGMFQWVKCQFDALGRCSSLFDLRKALRSLPKDLDDTYARILQRIDDAGDSEYVASIMQWLAYSTRPMSLVEIAEVMTVDTKGDPRVDVERRFEDPQDLLRICSGLVTTVHQRMFPDLMTIGAGEEEEILPLAEILQFAHFSVLEYMRSPRLHGEPGKKFAIHGENAHVFISETCMIYLLHLSLPQTDFDSTLLRKISTEYPLANYAFQNWHHHARRAIENGEVAALCEKFLQSEGYALHIWLKIEMYYPPDVDTRGKISPLHLACSLNLPKTVSRLISNGADVTVGRWFSNGADVATTTQVDSWTALIEASYHTCELIEIVNLLLDNGAEVDMRTDKGYSALFYAAGRGYVQTVQLLLNRGADINIETHSGETPLSKASEHGHTEILQLLLHRGASIDYPHGAIALKSATVHCYYEVVKILLKQGVKFDAENVLSPRSDSWAHSWAQWSVKTALMGIFLHDSHEIAELLIEHGADVNAQSSTVDGKCGFPLEHALNFGTERMVRFLIKHGADPSLVRVESLKKLGRMCYEEWILESGDQGRSLRVQEERDEPQLEL